MLLSALRNISHPPFTSSSLARLRPLFRRVLVLERVCLRMLLHRCRLGRACLGATSSAPILRCCRLTDQARGRRGTRPLPSGMMRASNRRERRRPPLASRSNRRKRRHTRPLSCPRPLTGCSSRRPPRHCHQPLLAVLQRDKAGRTQSPGAGRQLMELHHHCCPNPAD